MNRHSIGARLAMWNALFLLLTFAVTGVGTFLAIRDSIYDTIDADLQAQLDSLQTRLTQTAGPPLTGASLTAYLGNLIPASTIFRVGADTRWLYQSPAGFSWDSSPAPQHPPPAATARTISSAGHMVRLLTAPVSARGTTWTVEVAQQIDEYQEILNGFLATLLLASPIAVLLATGIGYHMSRRALAPVSRITETAQSIGPDNLAERLPLRGVDDELERLSATVNGMLARLEHAFRRVTQFTADASHELRTPVAVIRTAAEVSRRRPRTEAEYVETLDRILSESERASRLIDDLLTLARADAGDDGTAPEHIDLADLLRQVCEQQRPVAQAVGVRFDAALPPACAITGDRERLRRLFLILLDNAIKYTTPGGSVTVTLAVDDFNAVTAIRDTGVGIEARDLPHIFERFYRVAPDRSRETGGYGLGLSMAQSTAVAHDGRITVESEPKVGSVFTVTLPLDRSSSFSSDSSDVLQNRDAG